jgi:hypothetical protein
MVSVPIWGEIFLSFIACKPTLEPSSGYPKVREPECEADQNFTVSSEMYQIETRQHANLQQPTVNLTKYQKGYAVWE